jgi:hypothetical protein
LSPLNPQQVNPSIVKNVYLNIEPLEEKPVIDLKQELKVLIQKNKHGLDAEKVGNKLKAP